MKKYGQVEFNLIVGLPNNKATKPLTACLVYPESPAKCIFIICTIYNMDRDYLAIFLYLVNICS